MAEGQLRRNPPTAGRQTSLVVAMILCLVFAGAVLVIGATRPSQLAPETTPASSIVDTPAPVLGLLADAYSCGGLTFKPDATASSIATPSASGASAALQGVLSRLPAVLPQAGWTPAGESAGQVVYVAPNTRTPAPFAFVDVTGTGTNWVAASYGDCEPAVPPAVVSSALAPIPWSVTGPVNATSTALKLEFPASLCNEEFVGTTIWYSQASVTVTFWGRTTQSAGGSQAPCSQASATAPYTLTLAEPLASRQLQMGPASVAVPAAGAPTLAPTSGKS